MTCMVLSICVLHLTHMASLCQERLFCGMAGVLGATPWPPEIWPLVSTSKVPLLVPGMARMRPCKGHPGGISLARLIPASSRMACGFRISIHARCQRPTPLQGDFWAPPAVEGLIYKLPGAPGFLLHSACAFQKHSCTPYGSALLDFCFEPVLTPACSPPLTNTTTSSPAHFYIWHKSTFYLLLKRIL